MNIQIRLADWIRETEIRLADWIREDIEEQGEDIEDLLSEYVNEVNPNDDDTFACINYDKDAPLHLRFYDVDRKYHWDVNEVNNFLDYQGYN